MGLLKHTDIYLPVYVELLNQALHQITGDHNKSCIFQQRSVCTPIWLTLIFQTNFLT
jgi:hypothetical protein